MKQDKRKVKKQEKKPKMVAKNIHRKYLVRYCCIVLGLIAAITIATICVKNVVISSKYKYYKEKMEWFGFDALYNSSDISSYDKVKTSEVPKMVLGVLTNKTKITYARGIMESLKGEEYVSDKTDDKLWYDYFDIIGYKLYNEERFEKRANKAQAAIAIVQILERSFGVNIEITDTVNEKIAKNFDEEELELINKALSIGLIKNSESDVLSNSLNKGELNKMLIDTLETYSTIYYNNYNNQDGNIANIVTEEESLPSNAEKYPYVVDNASKEIYEIETSLMNTQISTTPKKVYEIYGEKYKDTAQNIQRYFEYILNVDYKTIDAAEFLDNINELVVYDLTTEVLGEKEYEQDVQKYVEYVKENKIVLKGKATPLLPIIYSDGLLHYLRTKIEFDIVNSDTDENLLFWDENTKYLSNSILVYVDVPVSPTYYSKAFRVFNSMSLMNYIVAQDGNVEIIE